MPAAPDPDRPPIWTRPDRGSRGPQPEHSRARIAQTAISLADAGGLAAVTMRAVAETLGTSAGSLYRYVASRDELVELMVDEALGELRLRKARRADWQVQLLAVAHELRGLYLRHPWLIEAGLRPGILGPNALRYFDRCLAILTELPNSTTAKMETLAMMTGVVTLFARPATDDSVDPARVFAAASVQAHPHLMQALAGASPGSAQPDLFDRTIRSVLQGLLPAE